MSTAARRRSAMIGIGALLLFVAPTSPVDALVATTTERVSVDSGSGGGRELPAMSADGSRVIFVGRGETAQGLWLRDRTGGTTYRLTTGSHFNPAISADGTMVAYVVYGTDRSIWLMDITDPENPGTPQRVDLVDAPSNAPSNGLSDFPSLNADGSLVAFQSTATNLTPGTPLPSSGGPTKVYLRDVAGETTTMVSVDGSGVSLPGNAIKPDITPSGAYIAFASEQVLVTPATMTPTAEEETTDTFQQVYVYEVATGDVRVASVNDAGDVGNAAAALLYGPTVSDDGQRVAFESDASNLVPFDTNGRTDAFLHDFDTDTTVRLSERTPFDQFGPLTPVVPVRLLDTRDTDDPLGPGETITVQIRGEEGVPATAVAAALNITAKSLTSNSFVTVYPSGETMPLASSLNLTAGRATPNAATAKIGADGKVAIYNNSGETHIVVDLNGYYDDTVSVSATGSGFTPVTPNRLVDSRPATPLTSAESRTIQVTGLAGVPTTATAVALNVTAVLPTAAGWMTVWPTGTTMPVASNLNFVAGQTVANSVIVQLGTGGAIDVFNSAGTTHLVLDVTGYWDPAALNGGMTAVQPDRLLDTRDTVDPLGAGETIDLTVIGKAGVPLNAATTVVLNVTAVNPTAGTYLTVFPTGATRPLASNLNLPAGTIRPNQVIVAVGDGGKVSIFNANGDTHLVVDVTGWFSGVQMAEGGLGAAVTGDGTAVAFESLAALTADDLNGVRDAYLRLGTVTERVSVAVDPGADATGTRVDGHTGETVPVNNGIDVNVGETPAYIAFVSNGDLAGDRPVGEETPGEVSTEPASYLRTR